MELQKRFSDLLLNYTKDKTLIASLWKDIHIHYSEKHRAYHNLQHLKEIFSYFDIYKNELEKPAIVIFSIFYHDIIYNIWNKNNEKKSADYAIQKLASILNDADLKEVYQQIIATKTHDAEDNDTNMVPRF